MLPQGTQGLPGAVAAGERAEGGVYRRKPRSVAVPAGSFLVVRLAHFYCFHRPHTPISIPK